MGISNSKSKPRSYTLAELKTHIDEVALKTRELALELLGKDDGDGWYVLSKEDIKMFITQIGGAIKEDDDSRMRYESLGEGRFIIHCDVNRVTASELAHELGHHLFLVPGQTPPKGAVAWSRTPREFMPVPEGFRELVYDDEEIANYFERVFFMPCKDEFENTVKNNTVDGICDVLKVARKFGVSYLDAETRGSDLGFWTRRLVPDRRAGDKAPQERIG